MAKMSFEEYLQARAEYNDYLKGQPEPEVTPAEDLKPAEDPKPAEDQKQEDGPVVPTENDMQKQLDEIKAAMGLMAKALQPSLGDIKPVGIDDVVKKFFDVE